MDDLIIPLVMIGFGLIVAFVGRDKNKDTIHFVVWWLFGIVTGILGLLYAIYVRRTRHVIVQPDWK